jgi:hypothetical protein
MPYGSISDAFCCSWRVQHRSIMGGWTGRTSCDRSVSTIARGNRSEINHSEVSIPGHHCTQSTALQYSVLHCNTLYCTPLRYSVLHSSFQNDTLHCTSLHYTTLQYTALHYSPFKWNTSHNATLHLSTLLSTTLYCRLCCPQKEGNAT